MTIRRSWLRGVNVASRRCKSISASAEMDFLGTASPSARRLEATGIPWSSIGSDLDPPVPEVGVERALGDPQLLGDLVGAQLPFPV